MDIYFRIKLHSEAEEEKKEEEDVIEGLYCTIKAGEVPPVPQNKFLMRSTEPRQKVDAEKKEENNKRKERDESGDDHRKDSRRMRENNDKENERRRDDTDNRAPRRARDAAGRKVKGRGALVCLFELFYILDLAFNF